MTSTIITKNSSTASSVPLAADLTQGELAVNVTDKRLFTENTSGTVVELGTNPTSLSVVGNATVGGTLGVTGATTLAGVSATTLSASSTVTLSGGTANGVTYLNGSKVLTSGSALTFDGTNFGLGTASPSGASGTTFAINGGAGQTRIALKNTASGDTSTDGFQIALLSDGVNVVYQNRESGYQAWEGNGSELMRLTSTGLGIGTSSPSYKLQVASAGGVAEIVASNSAGSERIHLLSRSSAGVSYLQSQNSNFLIGTYDNYYTAFLTNNVERMRLDTSGNLLVGTTSSGFQNNQSVTIQGPSGYVLCNHVSGTGSGAVYAGFAYGGSAIGSITQSGTTAVLYNTTSDQRLKENIQDADSASSLIDSLQVRKFDWKADGSHQRYGFVAQELVIVAPEAVHQPVNTEEMMAVDYSKLVPMLVKEIQSLRTRVAQLESN